jgi:hypothetical protein
MTTRSELAENYLRSLAESELRRYRGDAAESLPEATARVRAVATAFARTGALDPGVAEGVVEELTAALEIRSPGYRAAPPGYRTAAPGGLRRAHRIRHGAFQIRPGPVVSAGASPVSVTPVGTVLELHDGETDIVVYLAAMIRTPGLASLSAGVLSLPKGSLPRRAAQRPGLPPAGPAAIIGPGLPGVPGDLRAVDRAGQSYILVFNGGGDGTWSAGHFQVRANPSRGPRPPHPPSADAGWLDVGNDEASVRIDLTRDPPAAEVSTTENGLTVAEQFLRIRAEAMFASGYHDVGTDLEALAAVVPALRAVGLLPAGSELPPLIAALCHRYAVSPDYIPDPPGALPDRWAGLLTGDQRASWRQPDGTDGAPAAAHLPVLFPETDGVTTVLSGIVTHGRRSTMTGAFFGAVENGYPEGPCIWLRDDGGQWHVAKQRSWGSGGVIVFRADVIPPVHPSVSAADILVIGRTADVRCSVPLTWWTS